MLLLLKPLRYEYDVDKQMTLLRFNDAASNQPLGLIRSLHDFVTFSFNNVFDYPDSRAIITSITLFLHSKFKDFEGKLYNKPLIQVFADRLMDEGALLS
jgi:hypothetical protein